MEFRTDVPIPARKLGGRGQSAPKHDFSKAFAGAFVGYFAKPQALVKAAKLQGVKLVQRKIADEACEGFGSFGLWVSPDHGKTEA